MKVTFAVTVTAAILVAGCTHIPRETVSFFNLDSCPRGWADVNESWRGRYVVMATGSTGHIVGEALSPGENRVTGDHGHAGTAIAITGPREDATADRDGGGGVGWSYREVSPDSAERRSAGETVRPGTNAPYVMLRACTKR